jgi:uncharacterized Zn-finger protein
VSDIFAAASSYNHKFIYAAKNQQAGVFLTPFSMQQEHFDLRLTPSSEREYNALNDPHANYYFVSSAAKQRLKDLKRELRREKKKNTTDDK